MPSTRNSYTVQVGDDILTVASGHNVSISDLRRANNLTSDTLIPGQTLVIPAAE
jgi:LysM repeat protein